MEAKEKEYVKGLYLPISFFKDTQTCENIFKEIKEAGFNTFVFDIKDEAGNIHFLQEEIKQEKSKRKKAKPKKSFLLEDILQKAKEYNLFPIARIVCFKDPKKYAEFKEYRLKKEDNNKYIKYWLNPSLFEVQKMICSIVDEVARRGVLQIQLDYVRYPTEKISKEDESLFAENVKKNLSREKVITSFIKFVKILCAKYEVSLSADVFAIIAWQNNEDIKYIGQNMSELEEYLDYIHPMIYLSHFDKKFMQREVYNEPYFIVYKTIKLLQEKNTNAKIVPYLQAFSYKIPFTEEYYLAQIKAVEQAGANGYILWNIKGNYKNLFTWIKEKS